MSVVTGTYTYKVTAVWRTWTSQSAASNSVAVQNDVTPPTVSSINRVGAVTTNASSVSWTVTFSENVSGVDSGDFVLVGIGSGGTAPAITSVTGGPSAYTVNASTGSGTGTGTLGLTLVDNDSIIDAASNPLGGPGAGNGNSTGQVFNIDKTVPTVSSINRVGAATTNASSVSWTVTFSENVSGVDSGDFAVIGTGSGGTAPAITSVTGGPSTYTVNASTGSGTGTGTLGLNLVDNDSIIDGASNPLGGPGAGNGNFPGQVFTIDKTAPPMLTINRSTSTPTNASTVSWTVTYGEAVSGVTTSNFTLSTQFLSGTSIQSVTGTAPTTTWMVTASTGSGQIGTMQLNQNAANNGTVTDAAGNASTGAVVGQTYGIDRYPPDVSAAQIVNATTNDPGSINLGASYIVVANVADSGGSDVGTVTANTANIDSGTGSSAVSLPTCSGTCTFGGVLYGFKSAPRTSTGALTGGNTTKTFTITAADLLGNSATSANFNVTIDNSGPTPSSISTADHGGDDGSPQATDTMTVTFNQRLAVNTICSGWSDSTTNKSTTGTVAISNNTAGGNDELTITAAACGTFNFGSANLGDGGYVSASRTFGATGTASSITWNASTNTLVITLGTASGATGDVQANRTITYTPSGNLRDPAGNAVTGTVSSASNRQF